MNRNNNDYLKMATLSSKQIIADYVNHRLAKEGYDWQNCPPLPPVNKVNRTMRLVGDEFEQRYREVFNEMCSQLHITPTTAYPTFIAVVNELFSDGIKWGRVVALHAFGGALAAQCIEKEMPDIVDNIIDWVATYVDQQLNAWIIENGDWVRS
jgi:hypothetical protein